MWSYRVFGHFYLEWKYSLSYHSISPRWLWIDLHLITLILPDQRGFFNLFPTKIYANSGIRVAASVQCDIFVSLVSVGICIFFQFGGHAGLRKAISQKEFQPNSAVV